MTASLTTSTPRLHPQQQLSRLRRETGRESIRAFAQTYLPHYCGCEPAQMHLEIFEILEQMGRERHLRAAVAAPRGHAKSTLISLVYPLWCIVYERESFIVLVSDTADQAQDHLASIRRELRDNERLAEDFPHLCGDGWAAGKTGGTAGGKADRKTRGKASAGHQRKDDLLTPPSPNQPGGVRLLALGAEQKIRGRRNRAERPTLIIGDDLENEEIARSPEQRDKRAEWFQGTLLKAGSIEANTIVAGTIFHRDSLLSRLLDPVRCPGWITRRYSAVRRWADRGDLWDTWQQICHHQAEHEGRGGPAAAAAYFAAHRAHMLQGAEVLWPQMIGYERLMQQRASDGPASFSVEMQNQPADPAAALFRPEDLHYWDAPDTGIASDPHELLQKLRARCKYVRVVGACDPSLGIHTGKGDYTAIVTAAFDGDGTTCYVIGADIRRLRPHEALEAIMQNHKLFGYSEFGVEAVQFQGLLAEDLRRMAEHHPHRFRVTDLPQTTSKLVRFQSLVPRIVSGAMKFSRRHSLLREQILQIPGGTHDDGPDALEMITRFWRPNTPGTGTAIWL